jgi:putative membrane protein
MHFRVGFGPGPGGSGLFGLFVLLILAALVVLVILAFIRRHDGHTGAGSHHGPDASAALSILNERLARGEIEPEDYRARRTLLESSTTSG